MGQWTASAEHLNPFARSVVELSGQGRFEGLFDANAAAAGAAAMAASGMWNCPTLAFYQRGEHPESETSPNLRYVSESLQFDFAPTDAQATTPSNTRQMTKALYDAGVRMILGTWTGVRFILPGSRVIEELATLTRSGVPVYEALRMATANAATSLGAEGDFRTIALGNRADLVLLNANPLEKISNVDRRLGVKVAGHWFSEKRLDDRLKAIAVSYGR